MKKENYFYQSSFGVVGRVLNYLIEIDSDLKMVFEENEGNETLPGLFEDQNLRRNLVFFRKFFFL